MKTNLRITAILDDGGMEVTKGKLVYLIDVQRGGNKFWYVRYTNSETWNRQSAFSHLDVMMKEIEETSEGKSALAAQS